MAEKRRFSLSFSLAQREQRDAWERLSAVPPGQRMDAVCRMINGYMDQQELLDAVRQAVRQELQGSQIKITEATPKAESIQDDVLGFLAALQEEGDDTA